MTAARPAEPWFALSVATAAGLALIAALTPSAIADMRDQTQRDRMQTIRDRGSLCPPIWKLARLIDADGVVSPAEEDLFDETLERAAAASGRSGRCRTPEDGAQVGIEDLAG